MKMKFKFNWILPNENKISPVNDLLLDMNGVYLLIVLLLSIFANGMLLLVFIRFEKLRTPFNMLIFVMTAFNLGGSVVFPFIIHASFSHKYIISYHIFKNKFKTLILWQRWIWTKLGCVFNGFIIYFVGCMQIYLMSFLSYFRLKILRTPMNLKELNHQVVKKSVVASVMFSMFWTICRQTA